MGTAVSTHPSPGAKPVAKSEAASASNAHPPAINPPAINPPAINPPSINPWIIAGTVTLAAFMELLDTSIANVSLPYIGGGLGRSYDETTWILTSYLVSNAVVLPMSAWLSRAIGRRKFYLACVAIFTISSFFCGLAPSLGIMLLARLIQGGGGGGLVPTAQAILVDTFPPAKRASAFALYTIVIVTAPAIGPVLGGWITDNYNWRWVFFINVPIGILAFLLTQRFIHDPESFKAERESALVNGKLHIDSLGIGLVALGSAALEITLDRGQIDDWFGSVLITWTFIIAIVAFTIAIFWELHEPDPVIDLRLLKNRNFAIANVFYFVFGFGLFGTTTMIPQMLQTLYGYRAIDAGLVLGPGALVITLLAPIGAQLVQRRIIAPRFLLFAATIVVGIAMIHFSRMNLQTDYNHYALGRALQGLGYGFFFVPLSVITYSQLRPDQNNKAASLSNFFRNWGGSFGIAMITTMAERRQNFHQSVVGSALPPSSPLLQQQVRNTTSYLQSHGFSHADALAGAYARVYAQLHAQTQLLAFMDCFYIIAIVTFIAAPIVLFSKKFKVGGGPGAAH